MPSIRDLRDRYVESMLAVWIHDAVQAITGRHVYYGPNRGTAEWRALGAFAWGCDLCAERGCGGFCASLPEAKQKADGHAKEHGGRVRAAYYEG